MLNGLDFVDLKKKLVPEITISRYKTLSASVNGSANLKLRRNFDKRLSKLNT
jgi:hypothetical protein